MAQSAAREAVASIASIRTTVDQIGQVSAAIANAVVEQEAATKEIARNVQQASDGTGAVAENVHSLRRVVESTRDASADVLNSSEGVGREATALRQSMAEVIARLRA